MLAAKRSDARNPNFLPMRGNRAALHFLQNPARSFSGAWQGNRRLETMKYPSTFWRLQKGQIFCTRAKFPKLVAEVRFFTEPSKKMIDEFTDGLPFQTAKSGSTLAVAVLINQFDEARPDQIERVLDSISRSAFAWRPVLREPVNC